MVRACVRVSMFEYVYVQKFERVSVFERIREEGRVLVY